MKKHCVADKQAIMQSFCWLHYVQTKTVSEMEAVEQLKIKFPDDAGW